MRSGVVCIWLAVMSSPQQRRLSKSKHSEHAQQSFRLRDEAVPQALPDGSQIVLGASWMVGQDRMGSLSCCGNGPPHDPLRCLGGTALRHRQESAGADHSKCESKWVLISEWFQHIRGVEGTV